MAGDKFYSRLSMLLPDSLLRALGRLNVPVYRATRGRLFGKIGRAPVLLLTSTGRRSGQPRTAPVLYLQDGHRYVVIGSNAGNAREPAWSLNLKENPDADLEVRGAGHRVRARVAQGEERVDLWEKMNAQYGGFDRYDARTARDIAVFVLEPR